MNDYYFSRRHSVKLSGCCLFRDAPVLRYSSCHLESDVFIENSVKISRRMFLYINCHSSIRFDAMCMNICHLCHPGWTELHTAVCSGDKECVEQLENRMSVDAADGSGPKLWRVQNCKVLYSCC